MASIFARRSVRKRTGVCVVKTWARNEGEGRETPKDCVGRRSEEEEMGVGRRRMEGEKSSSLRSRRRNRADPAWRMSERARSHVRSFRFQGDALESLLSAVQSGVALAGWIHKSDSQGREQRREDEELTVSASFE